MQLSEEEMEAYKKAKEARRRHIKLVNSKLSYEQRSKASKKGWKKRKMQKMQKS